MSHNNHNHMLYSSHNHMSRSSHNHVSHSSHNHLAMFMTVMWHMTTTMWHMTDMWCMILSTMWCVIMTFVWHALMTTIVWHAIVRPLVCNAHMFFQETFVFSYIDIFFHSSHVCFRTLLLARIAKRVWIWRKLLKLDHLKALGWVP